MMSKTKRTVSVLLLLLFALTNACLGVFAETSETVESSETVVIDKSDIRVFKDGAEIYVMLTGTPGAEISVLMLEPENKLPNMATDMEQFYEGVAHAEVATLDEDGMHTYLYVAEEVGIYTLYVRGAEIDFIMANNDAPLTNPDRIYVEEWNTKEIYNHPDLSYMVSLSKADIDSLGVEAVAKSIKEKLDARADGRKTIFINKDLSPRTLSSNSATVWWDDGAERVADILSEFFKELYSIGGTVDFIHSDFEQTITMYAMTDSIKTNIVSDSRYPEFEAKLLARGYDKSADKGTPLNSVLLSNTSHRNYLRFNAVCKEYAAYYLSQAIYEPAKKHFPNVKYCEYNMNDYKTWEGRYDRVGEHPNYIAGNTYRAGTHSAPALYSTQTDNAVFGQIFGIPGETGSTANKILMSSRGKGEDFRELQGTIVLLRMAMNSSEDGAVTPWVATETIENVESFNSEEYRSEMFLHIALHNPDRLLYFNMNPSEDERASQAENLMKALDEANGLIAYEDRRTLNTEQADVSLSFALSGIYTNGKNIWRITPDDTKLNDNNFQVASANGDPTFALDGATITFPQGSIINVENPVSTIGYWVETPEGITPVITYADELKTESESAVISFYNEVGKKADLNSEVTVDAVASYKGFYGDKLNFIAAKYDADGKLIDIESKECGIFSTRGNAVFFNAGKGLFADSVKFFLWEDETIRPLATETIE